MKYLLPILCCLLLETTIFADEAETEDDVAEFVVLADYEGRFELNPLRAVMKGEAQVFTALYEGLTSYEAQYNLKADPALASSWKTDDEKKTYSFFIRPTARYSNGEQIIATHIRNTWLQIIKRGKESPFSSFLDVIRNAESFRNGEVPADQVGIEAISDTELKVVLKHSTAHFPNLISHTSFAVLHPSLLTQEDFWLVEDIPTSGPYLIVEKSKEGLLLEKNEFYWDADAVQIPRIRIILKTKKSKETLTDEVEKGLIHWVMSGEIDYLKLDRKKHLVLSPAFESTYLHFNLQTEPWTNPRIREALFYLIPWEKLRSPEIWLQPATSLVPPIRGYPKPAITWKQDVQKAYAILAKEGYNTQKLLPEIQIPLPGDAYIDTAKILQEAWKDVTKEVQILRLDLERYYEIIYTGHGTLNINSWIGDFADPLSFLDLWRGGSSLNNANYHNDEFDALLTEAASKEIDERYEILAEAEQKLLDDFMLIPLSHSISINVINLEVVGGWHPNPLDIHPFKYIRFSGKAMSSDMVFLPSSRSSLRSISLLGSMLGQ